jgi:hypothetical protein
MQTPKSTLCSVKSTRSSTAHCPTDIPQVEKIESRAVWPVYENIRTSNSILLSGSTRGHYILCLA